MRDEDIEKRVEFSNLFDAVCLIRKVSESLDEDDPHYEDFRFFSAINCTTQSEYRQELKTFLGQILNENAVLGDDGDQEDFLKDIENLYDWL